MILQPTTAAEIQALVKEHPRLLPCGGNSKPALSTPPNHVASLTLAGLSGVIEYQPAEYTFTALAGTPVLEVEQLLADHGQFLPFDPLLPRHGATLGGTVAADLNGPGRQRYGGIRDFLLGVRLVDGQGRLVRGGGKVVKNAAGFDLPKLMVGSLGRLGVLVELTFKVFPGPQTYATLKLDYPHLEVALTDLFRLTTGFLELYGLDLEPAEENAPAEEQRSREAGRTGPKGKLRRGGRRWTLWARLGGLAEAMPARIERLREFLLSPKGGATDVEVIEASTEGPLWQEVKEFAWLPSGWSLIKIPVTLKRISDLEAQLNGAAVRRRYSAGGNVVWLAWPVSASEGWRSQLNSLLTQLHLSGLVVLGPPGQIRLGINPGAPFARRIKQALDPEERFLEW